MSCSLASKAARQLKESTWQVYNGNANVIYLNISQLERGSELSLGQGLHNIIPLLSLLSSPHTINVIQGFL